MYRRASISVGSPSSSPDDDPNDLVLNGQVLDDGDHGGTCFTMGNRFLARGKKNYICLSVFKPLALQHNVVHIHV